MAFEGVYLFGLDLGQTIAVMSLERERQTYVGLIDNGWRGNPWESWTNDDVVHADDT